MCGKRETILTAVEAATVIRTAFGKAGWQVRARNCFDAATLVAALWVAQNETGRDQMRELIRWAREMGARDR